MQTSTLQFQSKDDIRNKHIACYLNMASMSPALELHAGVIEDLLSRNNTITVYLIDQSFVSPTENPFNRTSIYNFMRLRVQDALQGFNVQQRIIDLRPTSNIVPDHKRATLDLGVMSSIASLTGAQTKDHLNKKWLRAYDSMFDSAKRLYNYFIQEIPKEQYDYVFMFNGRFGCVKPVLEATRDSGIGYGLHEVKKSLHEIVFINELIHSIDGNTRRAYEWYEQTKDSASFVAAEFYDRKAKHQSTGDPVYTSSQKAGELPDRVIGTQKHVIAVYPTTEHEYKFIGKEWDGYVPESQVDEIDSLAKHLDPQRFLLVVKMHPNQANSAEHTVERYLSLQKKYPHVVVEGPYSKKDTYALLFASYAIVTFASTIGVEACYFGKPSIIIGDTNWSRMNVADSTYSGKEAAERIARGVTPHDKHGAIVWANYLASYKDALPGYERYGDGDYRFHGRQLGHSRWQRVLLLPAKFELMVSKPGFKLGTHLFSIIFHGVRNILTGKWAVK